MLCIYCAVLLSTGGILSASKQTPLLRALIFYKVYIRVLYKHPCEIYISTEETKLRWCELRSGIKVGQSQDMMTLLTGD